MPFLAPKTKSITKVRYCIKSAHAFVEFLASSANEEDNQENVESQKNDSDNADYDDDEERQFFSGLVR